MHAWQHAGPAGAAGHDRDAETDRSIERGAPAAADHHARSHLAASGCRLPLLTPARPATRCRMCGPTLRLRRPPRRW
jgi:hypothetical protein